MRSVGSTLAETLSERLTQVRQRIDSACSRVDRDPGSVTLVAVSKGHGIAAVRDAVSLGQTVFGESRVQEAASKIESTSPEIAWHMVGHLQRNKAGEAIGLFELIHSVDSLRLVDALDNAWRRRRDGVETADSLADAAPAPIRVLIQVNVSGESTKHGLHPMDVGAVVQRATQVEGVVPVGLMTIPPWSERPEDARRYFGSLRELRDGLVEAIAAPLPELSMGMSADFEVAIEEGATLVRVGTAIFG